MSGPRFKKGTRSNGSGGNNCVEVALDQEGRAFVRDSKRPHAAILVFTADEWRAFVESVKAGEFDH